MNKYKILAKEDIINKLKSMKVDNINYYYYKPFYFIVLNPDYDSENFFEEIEESEVSYEQLMYDEISKRKNLGPIKNDIFDTLLNIINRNSERWLENHKKQYPLLSMYHGLVPCINHENGDKDYYCEEYVDKFMEKYKNIVKII